MGAVGQRHASAGLGIIQHNATLPEIRREPAYMADGTAAAFDMLAW